MSAEIRDICAAAVAPGVTTGEIDDLVVEYCKKYNVGASFFEYPGGRYAPDFPGHLCVSLNDEVIHGIPDRNRVIMPGDLVKTDVGIFKNKQNFFKGVKSTFVPRDGFPEDPSKQGTTMVQSTVDEQFDWLIDKIAKKYLTQQFAIEATNSKGADTVELVVEGHSFGNLTALELMRLKSLLTDGMLDEMLKNIPVRSDSEVWTKSNCPEYAQREVYETPMLKGVTRTTEKHEEILKDPNIDPEHIPSAYRAQVSVKNVTVETGDYTSQRFSGEWTQTQKAQLLARKSALLGAVIAALKEVNAMDSTDTNLDVDGMLSYIFKGN